MKEDWLIVLSNSDNADVDAYRFHGSEDELKEKLMWLANNSDLIKSGDEIYMHDEVGYDSEMNTYYVVVTNVDEGIDDVYTAKRLHDVKDISSL